MALCVCRTHEKFRNLKRIFVEEIPLIHSDLIITGKTLHHLGIVLRVKPYEDVLVLDRFGKRALTKVEKFSKTEIKLKIMEIYEIKWEGRLNITVLQAILKGNSTDYIIQRLSELGVRRILFFKAKHSLCNLDRENIQKKLLHWDGVAIRSYLQCDRDRPLEIMGPFTGIESTLGCVDPDTILKILCHERAEMHNLRTLLEPLKGDEGTKGVAVAVGPEGGFEEREVRFLKEAGFVPIRFGPRIFMAESASIVFSAILQYELGDLG